MIAEYTNGALAYEYIYAGSQLVATLNSSGTPTYVHPDHLSARVFTDTTGAKIGERGHLPFGEVRYDTMAADKWKFTRSTRPDGIGTCSGQATYERDAESGLDYAMFRFDSPRLGRFQSPDPVGGSKRNPQSLNRYAYVRNDPVNFVDPLGLLRICWWNCIDDPRECYVESCIDVADLGLIGVPEPPHDPGGRRTGTAKQNPPPRNPSDPCLTDLGSCAEKAWKEYQWCRWLSAPVIAHVAGAFGAVLGASTRGIPGAVIGGVVGAVAGGFFALESCNSSYDDKMASCNNKYRECQNRRQG